MRLTVEHGPAGSLLCLLEHTAKPGTVIPSDFYLFCFNALKHSFKITLFLPEERPAFINVFGNPVQSDPSLVLGPLLLVGGDSNHGIRYKGLQQEPWQEMGVIK